MERVAALIDKLKQQYDQNVDKKTLMVTAQLLLAELEQQSAPDAGRQKVAVTLPRVQRIQQDLPAEISAPMSVPPPAPAATAPQEKEASRQSTADLPETIRSYILKPPAQPVQPPRYTEKAVEKPAQPEPVQEVKPEPVTTPPPPPIKKEPQPVKEPQPEPKKQTPVAGAEKEIYELNDVHIDGDSLNDRLKEEKQELGTSIKVDPVHDLRRAIGINDRYRFINELFRGDEAMYERSIKTINGFPNFMEAETWILRELKLKLGWAETNPSVKDFDQVVKRRFS